MTKAELIDLILAARTRREIQRAEKAIKTYTSKNGVDIDVLEAGEQLANLKHVAKGGK